jgi:hypothetical protein
VPFDRTLLDEAVAAVLRYRDRKRARPFQPRRERAVRAPSSLHAGTRADSRKLREGAYRQPKLIATLETVSGDDNGQYVEDLKSFAKKVGLKKTAPSAVLDALAPALKQLAGELEVPMRDGSMEIHRFLEEWKVDTASGNIIFRFFRENQRPQQQPVKNEFVAAIDRIRAGARK